MIKIRIKIRPPEVLWRMCLKRVTKRCVKRSKNETKHNNNRLKLRYTSLKQSKLRNRLAAEDSQFIEMENHEDAGEQVMSGSTSWEQRKAAVGGKRRKDIEHTADIKRSEENSWSVK